VRYRRIHGELAGLGVKGAAPAVWEILKASGIGPAPLRLPGPTWQQFLRSQARAILACDFFTADLLDGTQAYVQAVIEHATRRIRMRIFSDGSSASTTFPTRAGRAASCYVRTGW
jgi:putative transposase